MKEWGMLMLCIALSITKTKSAAVSTAETLVVTKTNDEVSPTLSSSDATTEEPNAPIKVTEMLVSSEVTMRYAHTAVVTHIRNPASKAQEATFHVLLPDTAFISGFVMALGGKCYKAYIKEKNEAKKVFQEAVSHGTGAAHIAAKARDSNHFTVSVNVEPKSVAIFNLTYEELLIRRNGVYNHAINLHPGTLVPKLEVAVHIKESQEITTLRVPEVRTGNEIDATDDDAQNSKAVQSRNGDKEARITFTPDLEEQMRLIKIYKDKTKGQRDGALGQFIVQYDVERSNNGEILVNDGYFVHFLAPKSLPTLSKHVVFVLDTSSSMMGRKVQQLKAAMDSILSDLNSNDYFNIVEFNSDFTVHQLKEADEPVTRIKSYYPFKYHKELVSPAIASSQNIAKAKIIIARLEATGGTNIFSALNVAIDLIHKFADDNKVAKNISKTNSTDLKEDKAVASFNNVEDKLVINQLEPIIIFLTDGDPTMGETSTSRIISHFTEKNSGDKRASLYSLAFGEDADRNFLRKLSLRNEGFMRHIYEASDAELQLRDFYKQVSSPLLAHVKFTYPKEQIKEGTVSKNQFRTVYAGSEVVVAGELADRTSEFAPTISAFCGAENGTWIPYEIRPKVPVSHVKEDYLPLERLWAYLTIKQLLDERDAADQSAADVPEKKALALALKYSFVTSLTSLVVVKPNETNAVDAEPADKNIPQQNYYQPITLSGAPSFNNRVSGGYVNQLMNIVPQQNYYQPITVSGAPSFNNRVSGGYVNQLMNIGNGWSNNQVNLHSMDSRILGGARYGYDSDEDYDDWTGYISRRNRFRNYHRSSFRIPSVSSTTPLIFTTEVPDEKKYHLENYSWALGLLNNSADALIFWENETQILLELSKDTNAPRSSGPDEPCSNTPASSPGLATCVYVTRCAAARNITMDDYRKSYCRVDNKYAGVCCPKSHVDVAAT